MLTLLAIDLGGPMGLMFGILIFVALGAGAGWTIGQGLGRTRDGPSLATTIRLTRERLAAATGHLEKASTKLAASGGGEAVGEARLLERRLADLSAELAKLERQAGRGASA